MVDWRSVAHRVSFVPAEHSRPAVGDGTAREMLRCSERDLSALIDAGLPAGEGPDGRLFDPNDLYNLGMYSGTGVTQPELTFRMLFKFTLGPVENLLVPRRWDFTLRLQCRDCAGRAAWSLHRPAGEAFGGGAHDVVAPGPSRGLAEFRATVTTNGRRTPLVSTALRKIAREYLDSGLRWQLMPEELQADPAAAHGLGATNCIAASLHLADRFRAEGYRAEARRGWFCGVLGGLVDLPHASVLVVDDDGGLKAVDPATAQLAARLSPDTTPFQELCLGSPFNRVVTSDGPATEPPGRHECGAAPARVVVRSDIRALRATAPDTSERK